MPQGEQQPPRHKIRQLFQLTSHRRAPTPLAPGAMRFAWTRSLAGDEAHDGAQHVAREVTAARRIFHGHRAQEAVRDPPAGIAPQRRVPGWTTLRRTWPPRASTKLIRPSGATASARATWSAQLGCGPRPRVSRRARRRGGRPRRESRGAPRACSPRGPGRCRRCRSGIPAHAGGARPAPRPRPAAPGAGKGRARFASLRSGHLGRPMVARGARACRWRIRGHRARTRRPARAASSQT